MELVVSLVFIFPSCLLIFKLIPNPQGEGFFKHLLGVMPGPFLLHSLSWQCGDDKGMFQMRRALNLQEVNQLPPGRIIGHLPPGNLLFSLTLVIFRNCRGNTSRQPDRNSLLCTERVNFICFKYDT